MKGFYSIHLNALYDLYSHSYMDAILQPVHHKDEFRAFCDMVDRRDIPDGTAWVYIGDRGYCSYNDMAHVREKHQFFLFRSKDVSVREMAQHLPVPKEGGFDTWLDVTVKRSHSKNAAASGGYITFVDRNTSFDFLPYGSLDTYTFPVQIVRLLLKRKLIPVRNGRIYPRLDTAYFRRPKYFLYRAV